MGKISSVYADKIYLTDDNPRSENPQKLEMKLRKALRIKIFKKFPVEKKQFSNVSKILSLET